MDMNLTKDVISATDDEILTFLKRHADIVVSYIKKEFICDDEKKLFAELQGMAYVASTRLINITRGNSILGKFYGFTDWGHPKRLLGSDPEKWKRVHCVALFTNGDRAFYVDICASAIRDLFKDDQISSHYPPVSSIPDIYVSTKKPWYFESDYDLKYEASKPTAKLKTDILERVNDFNKNPEKKGIARRFLDFLMNFKHGN